LRRLFAIFASALLLVAIVFFGGGMLLSGCAGPFQQQGAPAQPFDVVIVLGCPNQDDGRLSRCQQSRVLGALQIWQAGWTRNFIVSGSAVHSPYFEAEGLAAGMAAVGIPADHIYIEDQALHTDENMYYSMRIAHALGFGRIAALSNGLHAAWGCKMMADWEVDCKGFSVMPSEIGPLHARHPELDEVRSLRVRDWVTLGEKERVIARRTGRTRPPSFLLYPHLGWLRLNGQVWTPPSPPQVVVQNWAERARTLTR
jgi:vancomycin permeability regulator SanA